MHRAILFGILLGCSSFFSIASLRSQWVQAAGTNTTLSLTGSGSDLFAGYLGVLHSADDGATWISVSTGLPNAYVSALDLSGTNLFAAVEDSGVYLSTNKGATWESSRNGLPPFSIFHSFVASGTNLFAAGNAGVYLSTDQGASWVSANTGLPTGFDVSSLLLKGTEIFAGGDSGVFRSTNNGASWTASGFNSGQQVTCIAVQGNNIFVGVYAGGVFLSTDNGNSWAAAGPGGGVSSFAFSGTSLFAGSDEVGVYLSTDNGKDWSTIGPDGFPTNVLWATSTNLINGTPFGIWYRPLDQIILQSVEDTQVVPLLASDTLSIPGDSAVYHSKLIQFTNTSNSALIIESVGLTTSNNRFSIGQELPSIPDTVQPGGTFFLVIHFTGDTIGTVYRDTLVMSVSNSLTSSYIYLTGHSFKIYQGVAQEAPPSLASITLRDYPNPFSDRTTLTVHSTENFRAQVSIVNLFGEELVRLFDGELSSGEHSFVWDARTSPTGLYFGVLGSHGAGSQIPIILAR